MVSEPPASPAPGDDPFGTQAWRRTVLAGWQASPTRFREDANAEEDHARGAYRDRLVVELAQNAADAAVRAGVPGRLLLRLRGRELVAANTGSPLDASGVQGLATLRASSKRDGDTVGRFGVGFAAVLAVTDEPRIGGRGATVMFSASRTQEAVSQVPELRDELVRRGGHVPVLRLPFAVAEDVPDDLGEPFDTVVVLPLRDESAVEVVRSALAAVDDALLLTLPGLTDLWVDVDGDVRTVHAERDGDELRITDRAGPRRYRTWTAAGLLDDDLLSERPVEDRTRPGWSITWAVPVDDDGPRPDVLPGAGVRPVLHAPTPTDEPVTLPALLIATLPLEPGRRHVVTGAVADHLVARAAELYADLVAASARDHGDRALRLVPSGWAAGPLDAQLREAVLDALRDRPFVPAADGGPALPPTRAARVEPVVPGVVEVVASVRDGLAAPSWGGPAMAALGSPVVPLADLLDELAALDRPVAWWRRLYDALDEADPASGVLEGLPVPLRDGRVVRGPREVVCSEDEVLVEVLVGIPGLRVAAVGAGHRLLTRLGAVVDDPLAVLSSSAVASAVASSLELDDPRPVADAVLALVSRTGETSRSALPGLAALALTTASGEWAAAGELALPGSALADVTAAGDDELVGTAWVDRYGSDVLQAVGVASTFPVVTVRDTALDPDEWDAVAPDGAGWAHAVEDLVHSADDPPRPAHVAGAQVVLRLAEVADDRWDRASLLLREGEARSAVVTPVRVVSAAGQVHDVISPAAWWLRDAPLIDGRRPVECRVVDCDPALRGLFEPVVGPWADDTAWLRAVGVRARLSDLLLEAEDVADLLERLADPARAVTVEGLLEVYRALGALPESRWPEPPERLRVPAPPGAGAATEVVDAGRVSVALSPLHLPLVDGPVLPGGAALADLLDVPTSAACDEVAAPSGGARHPVPSAVAGWAGEVDGWVEHEDLVVSGVAVDAWVDPDGTLHAATVHGLARALAWREGRWGDRHDIAELLVDPSHAVSVHTDRAFD